MCVCRVHIRRTDKLQQEASYHSVEEYMTQVGILLMISHFPAVLILLSQQLSFSSGSFKARAVRMHCCILCVSIKLRTMLVETDR